MAEVETGKLVVTALTRDALPVLRFQTAGLTRVISRERQDTAPNCSPHRAKERFDPSQGCELPPSANRVGADEPTERRSNC